mmetsp:Transcript_31950/g.45441  ORF Transcript_31950/g.45441 Transcript_31950/m.45441 type:complete len:193 (+) Transcript_31950:306-884(+)
MSKVSSSIPQGAKEYLGNASKSIFKRENLRSLTVFMGLGEERPFYIEKNPAFVISRLQHNLSFFYLNYSIVFAVLFVITMITSLKTMLGFLCLGGAWLYVIRASADGTLRIGKSIAIPQKPATVGMTVISAIVSLCLLSHVFWWTVGSGGFVTLIHAGLRDASLYQDQDDRVEMHGSLEEEGEFLNTPLNAI